MEKSPACFCGSYHHCRRCKISYARSLLKIYRLASEQKLPTNIVANSLAEELFGVDTAVC
jgi:hypothetical protein